MTEKFIAFLHLIEACEQGGCLDLDDGGHDPRALATYVSEEQNPGNEKGVFWLRAEFWVQTKRTRRFTVSP